MVVVICAQGCESLARPACDALSGAGYLVHVVAVPAGEAAKDIAVATTAWQRLAALWTSAICGKTAVNIAAGKNLVGAFHPPAGVLADLAALATLPRREYVSGLAEVIKGSSLIPRSWI